MGKVKIWTVCVGDKYAPDYVQRLEYGVKRHMQTPYEFWALTDRWIDGVNCLRYDQLGIWLGGWWAKLFLFYIGDRTDTMVFIDVDSVIVGSLDPLIEKYKDCALAMPRNWPESGHGGFQSSLMIWKPPMTRFLYDDLTVKDMARLHGDQEWISERYANITPIEHPALVSYKYHCKQGQPPGATIVTFHGNPKPHEVEDEWVSRAWRL